MTSPNTSSDDEQPASISPLVTRLAVEFGADASSLLSVAALFDEGRKRAPDIFLPAPGALDPAFFDLNSGGEAEAVYAAIGEWALDAAEEPMERMRRDCLRFQHALTRIALRVYAGDAARMEESLLALQRFTLLQMAVLASLGARQGEGGVVRTLPTPEYAAFMEIFRAAIESHRQEERQLGLLVLDVGRTEQVDRVLGLQKGEAFMLRVTRRMREGVLRKQDQLGRVSRSQLACLLPRIAGEGVAILAANKILDALRAPIPLGDRSFDADVSIGIAVFPDHGEDQQSLVRKAKLAAVAARAEAERVVIYDPQHGESEEMNVQYEARLREALEQGHLSMAFAPQLHLAGGAMTALASVLRWIDPALGTVPETRALEAAESGGFARELTWWIYNNALRTCAGLAERGVRVPVVVNLRTSGLAQPDFAEFVERALKTWKVEPAQLIIEIHESALSGEIEALKEKLARLKALGVRLAIGAFGSAASSLSGLAQLPLDEAKISAEFVTDMCSNPVHAKIVKSLAHLAQDLGLDVAAEGVGDAATANALALLGCTRVQGAYCGPPLANEEILRSQFARDANGRLPFGPGN